MHRALRAHADPRTLEALAKPIQLVRRLVIDLRDNFQDFETSALWRVRERQGLPDLRELSLVFDKSMQRFGRSFNTWDLRFAAPVVDDLELLEIEMPEGSPEVASWVQMLNRRSAGFARLRLRIGEHVADVVRDGDGWSLREQRA